VAETDSVLGGAVEADRWLSGGGGHDDWAGSLFVAPIELDERDVSAN